jgi:TPR repeat protein
MFMEAMRPLFVRQLQIALLAAAFFPACSAAGDSPDEKVKEIIAKAESPSTDLRAKAILADMCLAGRGVPQDTAKAVKLFREIDAWTDANQEKMAGYVPNGTGEIRFTLGEIYASGDTRVPKDLAEAEKWYRKAAKLGHTDAQYALGIIYQKKDATEAVKWFRLAAEQGHVNSQLSLSLHYSQGTGVDENNEESARWVRKAAEQGNARAMSVLSAKYYLGSGVPKDDAEGARWEKLAAENGDGWIQVEYAKHLISGFGMPKDVPEGIKWLKRAAANDRKRGGMTAQARLGFLYLKGYEGVVKDEVQAVRWLLMAAEQGDHGSQRALGECYLNGTGVKQDEVEAYAWLSQAAIKLPGYVPMGDYKAHELIAGLDKSLPSEVKKLGEVRAEALKQELTKKAGK